ncbi:Serine protease 23 [Collichthys lucidus]|uniref:Serine protease 23 n=2 Tax=Sciaenidae TaxID=30870 RepID=A0A4U5UCS1_COLLU|nr:Serine protease 23 [Collichthys lucidus]
MPVSSQPPEGRPMSEEVHLRLILVSGKTQDFTFSPNDSATDIAKHVFENWPAGWEEERVSSPSILRLIFQGRFLHGNVTLGVFFLTTMMPRESSVLTHLLLHLLLPHTLSFLQPPHHPPPVHIPTLVPHVPTPLIRSRFSAHTQLDLTTHCNSSCFHRGEQEVQKEELTEKLAFETLYSDGSRTLTTVDVEGDEEFEGDAGAPRRKPRVKSRHKRVRRQIYGADGRFNIQGDNFLLDYPFSTAVRISTGCTGVLVSQQHVLTAAHCVHDGKDYVKGARRLRVGFLIPPSFNSTNADLTSAKKPLVRWMRMTLPGKRIHFSGFDSDRSGELVYRFCPVEEESSDLIYQHCDARPGASGSGVYGRVWDNSLERWERKVIGIFSGHQWLEIDGENRDYNVAVRITPLKFAQICYWVHGNRLDCVQD